MERPRRVVRFAQLIHRRGRAFWPAFGRRRLRRQLEPVLVATHGGQEVPGRSGQRLSRISGGAVGSAGSTHTLHFWLNLVEVFFSIIERQALRRGDFASVAELVAAIGRFCDGWNQRCQPFAWTKDADQILTKLNSVLRKRSVASGRSA